MAVLSRLITAILSCALASLTLTPGLSRPVTRALRLLAVLRRLHRAVDHRDLADGGHLDVRIGHGDLHHAVDRRDVLRHADIGGKDHRARGAGRKHRRLAEILAEQMDLARIVHIDVGDGRIGGQNVGDIGGQRDQLALAGRKQDLAGRPLGAGGRLAMPTFARFGLARAGLGRLALPVWAKPVAGAPTSAVDTIAASEHLGRSLRVISVPAPRATAVSALPRTMVTTGPRRSRGAGIALRGRGAGCAGDARGAHVVQLGRHGADAGSATHRRRWRRWSRRPAAPVPRLAIISFSFFGSLGTSTSPFAIASSSSP